MRVRWLLLVVPSLLVGGCSLNPHPEPPSEATASDSKGSPGGGEAGGSSNGAAGSGGGATSSGGSSAAGSSAGGATGTAGGMGTGGFSAGGGGPGGGAGGPQDGSALPDSPTPYCTNGVGEPAPCESGAAKNGEDGAFQGPLSVFIDEGDTFRDTLTQLRWKKVASAPIVGADVAPTACDTGFRVPSLLELFTLADFGRVDGQLPPFGAGATHFATGALGVATLVLPGGVASHDAASMGVVRCVSGPAFTPVFLADSSGVTISSTVGLRVERDPSPTAMSWSAALSYCQSKGQGARLPTAKELFTLVDEAATPRVTAMVVSPTVDGGVFWSSTADPFGPRAYAVAFDTANLVTEPIETLRFARCISP